MFKHMVHNNVTINDTCLVQWDMVTRISPWFLYNPCLKVVFCQMQCYMAMTRAVSFFEPYYMQVYPRASYSLGTTIFFWDAHNLPYINQYARLIGVNAHGE